MQSNELIIGAKVTGIVTGTLNNMVQVDLGTKHVGSIPTIEFSERHRTLPKMGDDVRAYILKINDAEGTIQLSINPPEVQEWSRWKSWKATTNEHSAVVAMQFLKELCEAYNAALAKTKDKYEEDKKRIYDRNRSNLSTIKNRDNTLPTTSKRLTIGLCPNSQNARKIPMRHIIQILRHISPTAKKMVLSAS